MSSDLPSKVFGINHHIFLVHHEEHILAYVIFFALYLYVVVNAMVAAVLNTYLW